MNMRANSHLVEDPQGPKLSTSEGRPGFDMKNSNSTYQPPTRTINRPELSKEPKWEAAEMNEEGRGASMFALADIDDQELDHAEAPMITSRVSHPKRDNRLTDLTLAGDYAAARGKNCGCMLLQ
jgi:hypothetical protein